MGKGNLSELVQRVNGRCNADCAILNRDHLKRPPIRFYVTVFLVFILALVNLYLGINGYLASQSAHSDRVSDWMVRASMGMGTGSELQRSFESQPLVIQMIPSSLAFIILLFQARTLWVRQRNVYQRYDDQLEDLENGAGFILYLRGFRTDHDKREATGVSRLEEEIVSRLSDFSNVVAIDNHTTPGITSGAVRIKCPDHAWRDMVQTLSSIAGCVIIDARDATPGLIEEIETHLDLEAGRCANTLFVYQDYKKKWNRNSRRLETQSAASRRTFVSSEAPETHPALYATTGTSLIAFGAAGKTQGTILMSALVVFARRAVGLLRAQDSMGTTAPLLTLLDTPNATRDEL